ncbi:uncharacterized protein LOC114547160 [Perca flavescens]|uniref:uncharacterized protein LOC114547160 n=1 Tax=Perca flavescens TaxID=8167 RepID=UPI00106E6167|nr:uncharacterized protein LOC114547160 [Perca flavescens]
MYSLGSELSLLHTPTSPTSQGTVNTGSSNFVRRCCDGSLMQTKKNRNRMWAFIIPYILGLNVYQASGEDNSTQMYYVKLTIEESAIANITQILNPFVAGNTQINDLKKTTECRNVLAGQECSCMPYFRWSNEVCQSSQKCCDQNCTFTNIPAPMCVSNNTVAVSGSIVLTGVQYHNCLKEKQSVEFQKCNNDLLKEMKTVFSTLRGFDILTITTYKVGSIVAEFKMTIAYREVLDGPPLWQLKRTDGVFQIFNGTESMVTSEPMSTSVRLNAQISDRWEGEYSCTYTQQINSNTITHIASAVMDIALLPNIDSTTSPAFPHCKPDSDFVNVLLEVFIQVLPFCQRNQLVAFYFELGIVLI